MIIKYEPIGFIHSPFKKREDIPYRKNIEPDGYENVTGTIEILEEFKDGLKDLKGFSHIIVLFFFHLSEGKSSLFAHPPFDGKKRGVFATRSPRRPNPIGMTVIRLLDIENNILTVSGIDMLDGTPVLDIKPYTLRDQKKDICLGWLEKFKGKK